MKRVLPQFIELLRAQRGLRERTIREYERELETYANWLSERVMSAIAQGRSPSRRTFLFGPEPATSTWL